MFSRSSRMLVRCTAAMLLALVLAPSGYVLFGADEKPAAKTQAADKANEKARGSKKAAAKPGAKADDKQAAGKQAAKKQSDRARRRLPAYYSKVVDDTQREAIYKIQDKYEPRIAKIEAQLQEMIEQRDAEIATVLTPAQRKQVSTLAAEAADKRRKGDGASSDADPPAADKPKPRNSKPKAPAQN